MEIFIGIILNTSAAVHKSEPLWRTMKLISPKYDVGWRGSTPFADLGVQTPLSL